MTINSTQLTHIENRRGSISVDPSVSIIARNLPFLDGLDADVMVGARDPQEVHYACRSAG